MNDDALKDAGLKPDTQDIVVDELFPHAPETIWRALTSGELRPTTKECTQGATQPAAPFRISHNAYYVKTTGDKAYGAIELVIVCPQQICIPFRTNLYPFPH